MSNRDKATKIDALLESACVYENAEWDKECANEEYNRQSLIADIGDIIDDHIPAVGNMVEDQVVQEDGVDVEKLAKNIRDKIVARFKDCKKETNAVQPCRVCKDVALNIIADALRKVAQPQPVEGLDDIVETAALDILENCEDGLREDGLRPIIRQAIDRATEPCVKMLTTLKKYLDFYGPNCLRCGGSGYMPVNGPPETEPESCQACMGAFQLSEDIGNLLTRLTAKPEGDKS